MQPVKETSHSFQEHIKEIILQPLQCYISSSDLSTGEIKQLKIQMNTYEKTEFL